MKTITQLRREAGMTQRQLADHLGVTVDQLRNWERNGLLTVPRDPETGYRLYGAREIGRLRVVRMLRQGGYSMMAILRMFLRFDAGQIELLRVRHEDGKKVSAAEFARSAGIGAGTFLGS